MPEYELTKVDCFQCFDDLSHWLSRTRDLVSSADTYTRFAFEVSLDELREGTRNSQIALAAALNRFKRQRQQANKRTRGGPEANGGQDCEAAGGLTRVWPRLFVGGAADAERLGCFNPFFIACAINLGHQETRSRQPGLTYVHLPISNSEPLPIDTFEQIMDTIRLHIRTGSVLVHCDEGTSRAPVLAAAYLHVSGFRSFAGALRYVAEARRSFAPSPALIESLEEFLDQ